MELITCLLVIACLASYANGDEGDDSVNNVFSDLAPYSLFQSFILDSSTNVRFDFSLLALFGEQFAKQFTSESMGWLDNVIFAMAPLGIITALVGAIRVDGPVWLKAVIGRSRENRAAAEIELMSSTVGELWNGTAIVRSLGRPEIEQLIYIKNDPGYKKTYGLYTLESATEKKYLSSEPYKQFPGARITKALKALREIFKKTR
ncbi:Similar to hypothetical protein [Tuber melanosporum Mel28]; acc. no. XP_002841517 [Pyronema omphalodes CBS 100304]|uniref:Uncharacterized protein n=1 Tax=Pyronema omphalodes (strain CBS 100304) TaxID=1076935 RepID=U4LM02_PYROM|nr:Similar to hypothetical protein [Tuber melanosporum Mel28]; acc. no. XP_002841517 [Pyronema omphalodes CBS 100304]